MDPQFAFHYLSTPEGRAELQGRAVGSTMPNINSEIVKAVSVPLPPLLIQRKIAAVLSAYDDLIENNNGRIKLLDEMAQRIYHEWFVNLRYPGHSGEPLVQSDIGAFPRGWKVATLGSVGKWFSGGTPSTSRPEFWNGGIPWITSGSLLARYLSSSDRTLSQAGVANGSRLVPRDSILFVVRGMSLAKEFRVGIAKRELAFGQDCKAVQAYEHVRPLLILHYLSERAPQIAKMVEFAAHGTGKLSTDRLMGLPFVIPPQELQQRFERIAASIRSLITGLTATNENLRSGRDQLLPHLMSGEIDVNELNIELSHAA